MRRAISAATKNKAAGADPVMLAILQRDATVGPRIGALIERVSLLDLGGSKGTATAEGAAQVASTAITPANVAPAPTRREFARDLLDSEIVRFQGLGGDDLSASMLDSLAAEGFDTWLNTQVSDILALSTGASYTVGTSNTALSWSAMQNGYLDMVNRGAVGPEGVFAAVRVKGIKDLGSDALSLGGAVANAGQVQQFLNIGAGGFVGEFFGGLRLYMLDDVPTSAPDDVGMMVSARGVQTAHKIIPLPPSAIALMQAGGNNWITRELKRSTTTSASTRVETAWWSAAVASDAAAMSKILYKTS